MYENKDGVGLLKPLSQTDASETENSAATTPQKR